MGLNLATRLRNPHPRTSPIADATKLRPVATRMRVHESLLELKTASCRAQTMAIDMLTKTRADISRTFSWLRPTVLLKKEDDTSGDASTSWPTKLVRFEVTGRPSSTGPWLPEAAPDVFLT